MLLNSFVYFIISFGVLWTVFLLILSSLLVALMLVPSFRRRYAMSIMSLMLISLFPNIVPVRSLNHLPHFLQ